MTEREALEFADRLEMFGGHPEAMGQWRHEYDIRLARMFGIGHELVFERIPGRLARVQQGKAFPAGSEYTAFESLSAAYIACSGDANMYYVGKHVRQTAALPSFEDLLANTMNRMLWEHYGPTNYRWRDIVTSFTSPRDFRQNARTAVQYIPDLPILPEDEPFKELTNEADLQGDVTYNVNELGALVTFTRRALINDDVGLLKRIVEQVKRSAWRTLAKRVWGLITSNLTYGVDGLSLFHANHGNVSTGNAATFCSSAITTARSAMFAQTEMGGQDQLGLGEGPLLLVVPASLEGNARYLNTNPNADASDVDSSWLWRFGRDCENIFANPLLTNALDWYLFDISGNVQILEVGFLHGQQIPRFEVADNPIADQTFAQDRVVYKVVHEYEAVVLDYRGAYAGPVS